MQVGFFMWFLIWENAARKGGRFRLAETRATHFDKKEPGTRIASRLSLVERVVGFDWLKRELLISIKKEPGTRIASRLSLVERVVGFDWLKRELLISIKKEPGTQIASRLSLVAEMVGFEPTCPSLDKTISSRSRYDHFDTSPNRKDGPYDAAAFNEALLV